MKCHLGFGAFTQEEGDELVSPPASIFANKVLKKEVSDLDKKIKRWLVNNAGRQIRDAWISLSRQEKTKYFDAKQDSLFSLEEFESGIMDGRQDRSLYPVMEQANVEESLVLQEEPRALRRINEDTKEHLDMISTYRGALRQASLLAELSFMVFSIRDG
ncbi:hypothetical protein PHMEG_00012443 [Phytophthora megakarya]|uniref:Uncharacterized protein n=1 Tax=Phytophthora megakarya TaxID=4795 RepID=A0A225W8P1_9STRA|nr:hypothetical protein PHMEG_00012443 [Phytophthora megakarya]